MERVRKGFARPALSNSSKLLPELLASDDLAFRAAAYAAGSLTAGQLTARFEEDGEIVFAEAIRNLSLSRSQGTRRALHDIAWGVVRKEKHSDLVAANQYNWMEKDVRKKNLAWFADEEEASRATTRTLSMISRRQPRPTHLRLPAAWTAMPKVPQLWRKHFES
jgi:hypothetical protein